MSEEVVNEKLIETQSKSLLEVILRVSVIEKLLLEKKIITPEEYSENFKTLAQNLSNVVKENMPQGLEKK